MLDICFDCLLTFTMPSSCSNFSLLVQWSVCEHHYSTLLYSTTSLKRHELIGLYDSECSLTNLLAAMILSVPCQPCASIGLIYHDHLWVLFNEAGASFILTKFSSLCECFLDYQYNDAYSISLFFPTPEWSLSQFPFNLGEWSNLIIVVVLGGFCPSFMLLLCW